MQVVVPEPRLIAATERDIPCRPADELRGPTLPWRPVATQNAVRPAAYRRLGRR